MLMTNGFHGNSGVNYDVDDDVFHNDYDLSHDQRIY